MRHTGSRKKEKGQVGHDLASLRKLIADSKIGRQPISRISELGLLPPPSFAHKHLVPKQWPVRPQSWSFSQISIYLASFPSRLLPCS